MARKDRMRLRKLRAELKRVHPLITEPEALITGGSVLVDGRAITNPDSLVAEGAHISIRSQEPLRGEVKLRAALDSFSLDVAGLIALDVGAAAGGFTRVLLGAGARRVYAVDVGHGQLLGSLRQDPRVVNLERTNLGELNNVMVPDAIDLVTLDLSYLALSDAIPQLDRVHLAPDAQAIGLVKPMFELGLATPPREPAELDAALKRASDAFRRNGWHVLGSIPSPVRGARGSSESLVHARRKAK